MTALKSLRGRSATVRFLGSALAPALALALVQAPAAAAPLQDAIGAPDGLTLKGSYRSRLEAIDGQFRPTGPENDFMWSMRTQILAEYDAGPIRFGAEVIDARAYFQKDNSSAGTSEINPVELSQAYLAIDLDDDFGAGSKGALTLGRFVMSVGSKRLIDGYGSSNRVPAYTGANLDWRSAAGDRLVAFWAMPHLRKPADAEGLRDNEIAWDDETLDLQFYGASFTKADVLGGNLELYGYGLNERDSADVPTANRRIFTPGARFVHAPATGRFDFEVEGAYQFGKVRASRSATDVTDLDVSAWFIHAEAGRSFDAAWSPRVSVHFDQATGDKADGSSYNRFDPLFGSRRTDFGPVSLYGPVSRANVVSGGLRFDVAPAKRWDASAMVRGLWLDSRTDSFGATGVRDRFGASGDYAGTQLEGRVRYWIVPKMIRADAGAAWLNKGRFLKEAPNAPATGDTTYAYFDLTIDF